MSEIGATTPQGNPSPMPETIPPKTRVGAWWLNLSLGRKSLALTLGPIAAVLVVLGLTFAFQARSVQERSGYQASTATLVESGNVVEWISVAESGMRGYAATGLDVILAEYEEAIAALPAAIREMREDPPDLYADEVAAAVADAEEALASINTAVAALQAGATPEAALTPALVPVEEWWDNIDVLRLRIFADINDNLEAERRWQDLTRYTLIGGLVTLVLTALAVGLGITHSVVGRVLLLAENVNHFWRGEPIRPSKAASDEIGQLTQTVADVGELVIDQQAELVESRDKAVAATRAKDEFLSRMSHELRTPLTAIIGFGQLMQMEDLNEDDRDSVNHIVHAGEHLLDLINEVLDISKIEVGHLDFALTTVDVGELVGEATSLVAGQAAERSITIEATPPRDLHVRADLQRAKQVLLNLLTNAVKYNHPGGRVTVECAVVGERERPESVAGERVRLSVTDTGPGIGPEDVERLFQPFERLGANARGIEGTGVGLALSRDLVEAMGGAIGVESTPGTGSTFWFELDRDEVVTEPEQPDMTPGPGPTGPRDGASVLYFEEDPANMQFMKRLFRDRPDELEIAMQGRMGLDLARQMHPDLVLLDTNLPDLDSTDVLHELKQDPDTSDIPVVVVSADATQPTRDAMLRAGARDFLAKPVDVPELLKLLDRFGDGAKAPTGGGSRGTPPAP